MLLNTQATINWGINQIWARKSKPKSLLKQGIYKSGNKINCATLEIGVT